MKSKSPIRVSLFCLLAWNGRRILLPMSFHPRVFVDQCCMATWSENFPGCRWQKLSLENETVRDSEKFDATIAGG